ncbi:serine/threonine protein kinase [Streptomyces sp. G3]|uniref:serine/threonine-protein kinase n=1 Tax=Streptomyces sp. G3 TaxID=690144 RepID=UPI00202DE5FD|nr:serine/threonine-protein kinase [Streptomyces sp. G3]MCM1943449.1 serine/threonine protein kinase [Streptomyces sp. G3]
MGHVWQGTDEYLERPVAVKTVAADLLALPDWRDTALARFEREAKATARLDHANITTVYDAAVTEDVCCLVMQLVDGTTLDNVIDGAHDGRLPVAAAVAVAAQLCSGLSAAHVAGLVHRDLKPQNIMVRASGLVKILGFGLVKVLSNTDPRLTMTGETLGNVAYASTGFLSDDVALEGRADLYAVGCLLYHMLTGRPPFPSSSGTSTPAPCPSASPRSRRRGHHNWWWAIARVERASDAVSACWDWSTTGPPSAVAPPQLVHT